tara:strand:+ start:378 stop:971 length:594 start_codon:yes stop_codon:yes gene_type:complete
MSRGYMPLEHCSPREAYYRTLKTIWNYCHHEPFSNKRFCHYPVKYGNYRRGRGYVYYVDKDAIARYLQGTDREYYSDSTVRNIFERLYLEGIFKELPDHETKYYKAKTFLADVDRPRLRCRINELELAMQKPVKDQIKTSYTLGGLAVPPEFYEKFSSRFREDEKGVVYTFNGSEIPENLKPLIESILAEEAQDGLP